MDQTSQETAPADDFYAQYVKERREKIEEDEVTIPASVTCHVDLQADVAEALLDLIGQHYSKYSLRSQAFLLRASKSIEDGMRDAANAFRP